MNIPFSKYVVKKKSDFHLCYVDTFLIALALYVLILVLLQ